jgi:hypothetical protein
MANINIDEPINANAKKTGFSGLVHHVMQLVRENRDVRDRMYKKKWDKYERTFRGMYVGGDQTRDGERSKLVAPALAASIEGISASIEDAIFDRERWFDISDDVTDQEKDDVLAAHKRLEEDFDRGGVPDAIAKIVLNGSLYGTGIGKLNVTRQPANTMNNGKIEKNFRPIVTLDVIPPWEFVIDSQARDIASAYFVAHETNVPRNVIWAAQKRGLYHKVALLGNNSTTTINPAGEETPDGRQKSREYDGSVFVTEYYGLVPAKLMRSVPGVVVKDEDILGNGHVEVIITIGNELEILRAIVNPFVMKDRPIIAYQHSVVPGKFWGRGVAEKGWNAQRALDAELRARMDALSLLTSPMMGADITRLPRNPDMRVRPGKVWLTRGRPSEVLEPVILGNIDPNTFNQSSEMERLVQVATGGIESNAPLNVDRRNETASGIGMIQSSALKRMRRTMWNMERQFLNPLIKKSMWRYMQFAPKRYPTDYDFTVRGTMGMVAREFEQAQLSGLLSNIPPDSPQHGLILKAILELSGSPKRDEILAQLEQLNKPDPEEQKMEKEMKRIQFQGAQEALKEQQLENEKTQTEIFYIQAQIKEIAAGVKMDEEKLDIDAANSVVGQNRVKMQGRQIEAQERTAKRQLEAAKDKTSK